MKKTMSLALILIFFVQPTLALDQQSCEISQKSRLSEAVLRELTTKICVHTNTPIPQDSINSEKQYNLLSASDLLVYEYTDNCSQQMNSQLLKTENQDPEVLQLAQQLDAILCEYPQHGPAEVFRGVNLPEEIIKKYLNSNEITFPAFPSSSKSFQVGCQFAGQGNTLMRIISKSGRLLENISKYEAEQEVLFRLNTRFKVNQTFVGQQAVAISGCKGIQYYLDLEEIN